MKKIQGFSLIEVLISILLFGIISTFLFYTFSSSVQLNNQAQYQIGSASQAQQIIETVRSAWSVPGTSSNYDYACVPNFVLPTGYKVQFWNLSSRAEYVSSTNTVLSAAPTASTVQFPSTATTAKTCSSSTAAAGSTVTPSGSTAQSPVMRRVTVTSGSGAQDTTLTLDILDPQ